MEDIANAADRDEPRQVATGRDVDYALSIEQVSERYAAAGHARTIRTLQRYCASGHLDAQKIATTTGDKYLVTPQSVARHLAQIEELRALDTVAVGRDEPRPVAPSVAAQQSTLEQEAPRATGSDSARPVATPETDVSRYVARLEREVEQAKDERDRETLVRGLQEMLTPLLGAPRRDVPADRPLH